MKFFKYTLLFAIVSGMILVSGLSSVNFGKTKTDKMKSLAGEIDENIKKYVECEIFRERIWSRKKGRSFIRRLTGLPIVRRKSKIRSIRSFKSAR
jgi:hypothetical protein